MTDTLNPSVASLPAADREPRSGQYLPPERGAFSVTFRDAGEFAALDAAIAWLAARGFSVGVMQGSDPIAVFFGEAHIAKWRNLSPEDHEDMHGKITPTDSGGSMRAGPVTFHLRLGIHSSLVEAFLSEPGEQPDRDCEAQAHVEGRP